MHYVGDLSSELLPSISHYAARTLQILYNLSQRLAFLP